MIDKFWHLKKKRSRTGSSERTTGLYQGGNFPKSGPQNHVSGSSLEIGSQREEKSKNGLPNKRARTSLLDMDFQANGTTRTSGPLERDKDMLKAINGAAAQLTENDGAFSAVPDGWERSKLKKKRSIIKSDTSSSCLARSQGGEREVKRGMPQKLNTDARPRNNHTHSFRSGSDSSTQVVENSDSSPQLHAPNIRSRNELSNGLLLNERRDVRFGPETESSSHKVINKPNNREDRCTANPAFLKFGSFRPRTNSCSVPKTSTNIHRVMGNSEDVELPQTTDKLNALGVNNRKRAASIRSSSPPVGQWAVHRPKKLCRSSRRSSLSPLVSSQDELTVSEAVDEESNHHDSLAGAKHVSSYTSHPSKMRGDNSASASLSESEESGLQENKLQYKMNKFMEKEDKSEDKPVQKSANLITSSRKNRLAIEEDIGDSDRRQGKIGRGFAPARSGMSARNEKLGESVTAKQQRSVRHGSERFESKPGRPPIKKLSERKTCTRPRQSINISSVESTEEAAIDHEELVAAATAALDTGRDCSSAFWKQLEPVFGAISSEEASFLREQIQFTNESAARTHGDGDNSQTLKVDRENATISSGPLVANACKNNTLPDVKNISEWEKKKGFAKERVFADPYFEEVFSQTGSHDGVSICQALLSAIIAEDDIKDIYDTGDFGEEYLYEDCYPAQFELEKNLKSKVLNLQPLDSSQTARRTSDSYKGNPNRRFRDGISSERLGTNGNVETYNRPLSSIQLAPGQLGPEQTTPQATVCSEFQYNQMSIDDRIILELNEIGLYPELESVPDLTYGEEEDIADSIHMLQDKLRRKAADRGNLLLKVEKAVMEEKELQLRKFEKLAMNHLVQTAHDKYVASCGPSSSGFKSANKTSKHSSQAFIKRVLARAKKFEETGISCFSEPPFRDIFLSASTRASNSQNIGISANDRNPTPASQIAGKVDTNVKCSGAAVDRPFGEDESGSNRAKKKELFLDDVACRTTLPTSRTPVLGNSLASGAKGKRSERDRDNKTSNRDPTFKNGHAKIGRPSASSGSKGERKNKPKPKMKMTQLSASVNALHSKDPGAEPVPLSGSGTKKSANDSEAVDLSNLQLPDIDVGDFGGQGQDISSWLNFEEEGLQDHDCVGLEIPMDDLSDVHMMI
ncbi:hypothetical protein KSP40_PGU019238 [Platanthera guangdongensis]|uniref:Uncharacterized protein n=1 Tax=Platanthera guangdongensis TaxID=2320717 RepID=A0ABR2M154_9ASPA